MITLKENFTPKLKFSLFTQPLVIQNLYDLTSLKCIQYMFVTHVLLSIQWQSMELSFVWMQLMTEFDSHVNIPFNVIKKYQIVTLNNKSTK